MLLLNLEQASLFFSSFFFFLFGKPDMQFGDCRVMVCKEPASSPQSNDFIYLFIFCSRKTMKAKRRAWEQKMCSCRGRRATSTRRALGLCGGGGGGGGGGVFL